MLLDNLPGYPARLVPAQAGGYWLIQAITAAVLGGISLGGGRGSVVKGMLGAVTVLLVSNALVRLGFQSGSTSMVLGLILLMADQGLAIIMISSYLPEIMNLSDRILVCRQGRVVEEFVPGQATEEKIMYAAVH